MLAVCPDFVGNPELLWLMRRTQAVCDVMFVPFNRCMSTPMHAAMAPSCFLVHHAFTLSLSSLLADVAIARTSCALLEMVGTSDFLRTACLMSSQYILIVAWGVQTSCRHQYSTRDTTAAALSIGSFVVVPDRNCLWAGSAGLRTLVE